MEHRRLWFAGGMAAAAVGSAAHRASRGPLRDAKAVQRLYERLAPTYDAAAWVFRPVGARRLQERAVALGRGATAVFGVTRAYEDIRPWRSVQRNMDEIAFETAAGGALHLSVARTRSGRCGDAEPPAPLP